jgi:hypothetical protein
MLPCFRCCQFIYQLFMLAASCRIFKAIQWLLFRMLVVPAGYQTYIVVFYLLSGLVIGSLLATAWIAIVMKGSDSNSAWLNRLVRALQLFAMVIYTIFWPAILDFFAFLWDCRWNNISAGGTPTHIFFTDQSKRHMHNIDLSRKGLSGCRCIALPCSKGDVCGLMVFLTCCQGCLGAAAQHCHAQRRRTTATFAPCLFCCRLPGNAAHGAYDVCCCHVCHLRCHDASNGEQHSMVGGALAEASTA